jgi:hypothetical protein
VRDTTSNMWDMSKQQTEISIGWMAREHWTDLQEPMFVFLRRHRVQRSQRLMGQQAHRSMQLQSDVCQGFVAPTVAIENELPCHGPQAWCVLITKGHTVVFLRKYNFGRLASDRAGTSKYPLARQLLQNSRSMSGTSEDSFNRTFDHLCQYAWEVSVEVSQGIVFWTAMPLRKTNSDRA